MESIFFFFSWLTWSYPKEMTLEWPKRRAILEANYQKLKSTPEDLSWAWPLFPGGLRFLFQDVFYSKCILLHIHIKPHSKSKVKRICDLWPEKMFGPDVFSCDDDWKVTPCSCDAAFAEVVALMRWIHPLLQPWSNVHENICSLGCNGFFPP